MQYTLVFKRHISIFELQYFRYPTHAGPYIPIRHITDDHIVASLVRSARTSRTRLYLILVL
jgi:hypothetical protein